MYYTAYSGPLPPPELQEVLKNDNCTDERINLYTQVRS